MNKLALISLSLASLVAVVGAQPAPPAKAPPAGGAPAQPAERKPAPPPTTPTAPPKPPEVPAELVEFGKQWAGTWKCTGQSDMMGQTIDVKATVTNRVDATLNKFWIQSSFTGTAPKMPPMKGTWYTTYDPAAKKLWRVNLNARGGHGTSWGTIADKKISWEGEGRWGGVDVKTRTTEEMISAKELKVLGEASKDGGRTWAKEVDATCKK